MDLVLLQPFLHAKGGLEKVVLKIAERHSPIIYSYRYLPENTFSEFKEFDIKVVKPFLTVPAGVLPERVKWGVQSGDAFWNLKIKHDYDVLNAHGTPSEWARNKNERMLWYCHSPNREAFDLYEWRMKQRGFFGRAMFWSSIQFYKFFEFKVINRIERIATNSVNSQFRIKKYLRRDSKIIPPGVDVNEYMNNGYGRYFFYPSRITPEKRFEYAISAFKKSGLREKGYELIIAGSLIKDRAEHVMYYEKIRDMIKGYGRILLDVSQAELKQLYSEALCVVFTPVSEDFGIIPLEAMASEKPVIAVNEGGPKETIAHGRTGYLVNSVDEMAETMKMLADNMDLVERIGRAGREHVKRNFSWERFFKVFDSLLKEVAKNG